jgi:hypothetical protein
MHDPRCTRDMAGRLAVETIPHVWSAHSESFKKIIIVAIINAKVDGQRTAGSGHAKSL